MVGRRRHSCAGLPLVEAPALRGGMVEEWWLLLGRRELQLRRGQGCFCIPSLGTTDDHQGAQGVLPGHGRLRVHWHS